MSATLSSARKLTLPISPEYVSHWGLWEAVREIYQNALDESGDDCEASIDFRADGKLSISTSRGRLTPETLVLGKTAKRNNPKQRGKFGEGYKLALLVLARLGLDVEILTGAERWTTQLEHDEEFGSVVLRICIEPHEPKQPGTDFVISGISLAQWRFIQGNIHAIDDRDAILCEPEQKGRIYVGGLYVSTVKDFLCGYAFAPGTIKLDRDRGMVDGFDLSYETSRLWTLRGGSRAVQLLNANAPDVAYVTSHAQALSPLVASQASHFFSTYGHNSVPVSNQDEIERATQAGMKWVLVPESVKSIMRLVRSWVIPSTKSPLVRLQEFRGSHQWRMDADMLRELDEIIEAMGGGKNP